MSCCKDFGGDELFCENRAMGKWTCQKAENIVKYIEVLWETGELEIRTGENNVCSSDANS